MDAVLEELVVKTPQLCHFTGLSWPFFVFPPLFSRISSGWVTKTQETKWFATINNFNLETSRCLSVFQSFGKVLQTHGKLMFFVCL